MLGAQLLIGLQYRAAFAPGFSRLPVALQMFGCVALLLILASTGLLLSTPAFHQIAEAGRATTRFVRRASVVLQVALVPLSAAIGINVAIALQPSAGGWAAGLAAAIFAVVAVLIWHVVPTLAARHRARAEDAMEDKEQSLETRIGQLLTELRVVLPGAQALFGFQVSAVLTNTFGTLGPLSRTVHLVSMGMVVLAIVLLIAPTTYHRIAARGNADKSVLRYTVGMMLPAEGLIAAALVGDSYVTVTMVTSSSILAGTIAVVATVAFATVLYGVPLAFRSARSLH